MYGTQTIIAFVIGLIMFENDVKMYGTQTILFFATLHIEFENDVKMYGTQTYNQITNVDKSLRMM